MFYLTMHSTHLIYGYMETTYGKQPLNEKEGRKEGKVSFNDTFNTFYLRLYSKRGNMMLPLYGPLSPISSKVFYMHHPSDMIVHTKAFCYTSCYSDNKKPATT